MQASSRPSALTAEHMEVTCCDHSEAQARWFVVWTKPRQEDRAFHNLHNQGFEVYLPRVKERRRVASRMQWVQAPLFPRYMFLHADPGTQSLAKVRSTLGCVDLVRRDQCPVSVPDSVIQCIRSRVHGGALDAARPESWEEGAQLEVVGGPLAGMPAVFAARSGNERVRVLLQLMGQWQPVSIQAGLVRLAG